MRQACRTTVLAKMTDLRRPIHEPEGVDAEPYTRAWKEAPDAESHILEIAELAYLLQADGIPVPEVFKRIGSVLDPPPHDFAVMHRKLSHWSNPLHQYVSHYLKLHCPADLELDVYNTALALAELWGQIFAEGHSPPGHPRTCSARAQRKPPTVSIPCSRRTIATAAAHATTAASRRGHPR